MARREALTPLRGAPKGTSLLLLPDGVSRLLLRGTGSAALRLKVAGTANDREALADTLRRKLTAPVLEALDLGEDVLPLQRWVSQAKDARLWLVPSVLLEPRWQEGLAEGRVLTVSPDKRPPPEDGPCLVIPFGLRQGQATFVLDWRLLDGRALVREQGREIHADAFAPKSARGGNARLSSAVRRHASGLFLEGEVPGGGPVLCGALRGPLQRKQLREALALRMDVHAQPRFDGEGHSTAGYWALLMACVLGHALATRPAGSSQGRLQRLVMQAVERAGRAEETEVAAGCACEQVRLHRWPLHLAGELLRCPGVRVEPLRPGALLGVVRLPDTEAAARARCAEAGRFMWSTRLEAMRATLLDLREGTRRALVECLAEEAALGLQGAFEPLLRALRLDAAAAAEGGLDSVDPRTGMPRAEESSLMLRWVRHRRREHLQVRCEEEAAEGFEPVRDAVAHASPACMRHMIGVVPDEGKGRHLKYAQRVGLGFFLRDLGLHEEEVESFMLSDEGCIQRDVRSAVQGFFRDQGHTCWGCNTLRAEGLCPFTGLATSSKDVHEWCLGDLQRHHGVPHREGVDVMRHPMQYVRAALGGKDME